MNPSCSTPATPRTRPTGRSGSNGPTARAADPQRADRHHQAEREALSRLECQKLYAKPC